MKTIMITVTVPESVQADALSDAIQAQLARLLVPGAVFAGYAKSGELVQDELPAGATLSIEVR